MALRPEPGQEEERPRPRLRLLRDIVSPGGPLARPARRGPSILQSFNYALEGIIHVLRTQRNMRIHFALAVAVLVLAFSYGVSKLELVALMLAIAFVLIAEMVNTAIEATIDVATTSFDRSRSSRRTSPRAPS